MEVWLIFTHMVHPQVVVRVVVIYFNNLKSFRTKAMDKESEVDPPEYLDYTNEELGNTEEVQELETYGREVSEELEGEPVLSGEEDTSVDKDTFESPTPENEQEDEEEVNQSGTIPHEYLVGDVSLGEEDTVLEVSYELQQAEQEEDVEETATEEKQFDIIETVTEKTDEVPLYQETPPPGTPPSPPIDDINLPPEQDTPLSEKFEDLDVMGSTDDNQVPLEDLMTMEDPVVVLEYEDTKVLLADYPPNEDIKVSFDSKVTLETLSTEALLSSEVFFDATPNEIPVVSDVPVQNEVPSSNIDAILSKLSAVNNVSSSSEVLLEESTSSEASNKENTQVTTTNKPMKKKKTARSSSTKQSKIAQTPPARSSLKESPKSLPKVTPKSEPRPESGDRRRSSGKNVSIICDR